MFEKAIEVIGMCRSGHHAIMSWIQKSFNNYIINYNNVNFNGVSIDDIYGENIEKIKTYSENLIIPCFLFNREDFSLDGIDERKPIILIENVPKETIVVLRDPYNWIASRLVFSRKQGMSWLEITKDVIERYKTYILQALGVKNYFSKPPICVNYNNWFSNKKYRHDLSIKLKLSRSPDIDECEIRLTSFQEEKKASSLRVNSRWEDLVNDKEYIDFFKDEELIELSYQYFKFEPPFVKLMKN